MKWVLRQVLELHPTTLTQDELIRELNGGRPREFNEVDRVERTIRDLAGTGLLHRPGEDEMVHPTRSALRYFELIGGVLKTARKKTDPNQALLDALRNPLRRSLLRRYVESSEMLSPKELAALDRRVRGSIEHFYLPTDLIKKTPWVLATLGLEG